MTENTLPLIFRWLCYAILIGLIALVPRLDLTYFLGEFVQQETSEFTWLELLQVIFLILTCLLFALSTRVLHRASQVRYKSLSLLLAAFFMGLLIREADYFLDYMLFDGAWQVLVSCVLIGMIVTCWLRWSRILEDIAAFSRTASFSLVSIGLLILVLYSRLFGKGDFWEALMGEHYIRPVKDVAEEGIELLGVTVAFIGSIEFLRLTRRTARAN